MTITRRDFLKATTATTVGLGVSGYGLGLTSLAMGAEPEDR